MEVKVSLDKLNCGKPSAGQELTTLSWPSSSVLKEVATLIQYICTCIIYAKLVAARHMTANSKGSLIKEGKVEGEGSKVKSFYAFPKSVLWFGSLI